MTFELTFVDFFSNISADTSRIYLVLEEIMADVLSNLHDIQKSLDFWQSRAEVKSTEHSMRLHFFFLWIKIFHLYELSWHSFDRVVDYRAPMLEKLTS